jgi:DNA-binding NtrC family response regulator
LADVLVCDDEPKLARLTAGLLESAGCQTVVTSSADGALAVMTGENRRFDVVLLDIELRYARADVVLCGMRAHGLQTPVILTSGYPKELIDPQLICDPQVVGYLAKPYPFEHLVDAIRDIVDGDSNAYSRSDARQATPL